MPQVVEAGHDVCSGMEEESHVRNYTFSVVALGKGKKKNHLSLTQCLILSEVKTQGE